MRTLNEENFIKIYKPNCNDCTPYPDSLLKRILGNVIWDKRDYSRIASNLLSKTIWTVLEEEEFYVIIPGILSDNKENNIGYIVTNVSYERNDIGTLQVIIDK